MIILFCFKNVSYLKINTMLFFCVLLALFLSYTMLMLVWSKSIFYLGSQHILLWNKLHLCTWKSERLDTSKIRGGGRWDELSWKSVARKWVRGKKILEEWSNLLWGIFTERGGWDFFQICWRIYTPLEP